MKCPVCLKEINWWKDTFKVYKCGHAISEFMSEPYQKIETEEIKEIREREWKEKHDIAWMVDK